MARITGKAGKVTLAAGTVLDITNWSLDTGIEKVDSTAMQDTWKEKLPTFKFWSASVEGHWRQGGANDDFWSALDGAVAVAIELFPVSGQTEKWAGSCLVDFSIKTPKDGMVDFTGKVEGTGALTYTS